MHNRITNIIATTLLCILLILILHAALIHEFGHQHILARLTTDNSTYRLTSKVQFTDTVTSLSKETVSLSI